MSGRNLRRAAGIALALLLVCSTALAALSYPFFTTTTDSVRLRRSASVRSVALRTLAAGTEIEVLGKTGSFYKVRVDGKTGYILQDFVNTSEEAVATPTPKAEEETVTGYPYATVTKQAVNLRETKSVKGTLLEKIPAGENIVVLSVSGTWAEIEHLGTVGYVKSSYIALKKISAPKATATPEPTATLSPEELSGGYIVLMKGSEGAEVKALQQAMLELGFLRGEADGKYGLATENAVLLFQQANDYPTTGVMDANAQAFLYSGTPKNSRGEAMKVNTASPAAGASLKLGNTGDPVFRLQAALATLGYYNGVISGVFDKDTQKAVIAFQKQCDLKADGVAGMETQQLLYSGGAPVMGQTPPPTPSPTPTMVPSFEIPSGPVKLNSQGNDAKLVQSRLKDLGYYRGRVDGKFGSQSVLALKKFQENNGLEPDGIAGETTYQLLFSWGALRPGETATPVPTEAPAPTGTPAGQAPAAPTAYAYETLRKGMAGDAVRLMQEGLINLGYLAGPSDGVYGDATVSAVRSFQRINGLTVDGTAGPSTLSLLYSGSAKAAPATPTPKPTQTPAPTAAPTKPGATAAPTPSPSPAVQGILKQGAKGEAVKKLQTRLIELGFLKGKADGDYGKLTYDAVVAFQKANKLMPDGIAGTKTQTVLFSSQAVGADGKAQATPTVVPTKVPTAPVTTPTASQVLYANWYTTVKAIARRYPYATVYDFKTGLSWQVHIFSLGAHADYEPLTAADTAKMLKAFGGSNTWNPRPVWTVFADGSVYMSSTHSMPHGVQHRTDNLFAGHSCLHFPRTQEQVTAIGTYATSHQATIDAGWAATQAMR